jgi:leader peptidase (prepilin peptidase) / N-methyltransferase
LRAIRADRTNVSSIVGLAPGAPALLAVTGLGALSSIALIPVVAWGLLAGSVAAWVGHRYAAGTDDDGYEIAVLGDATCTHCGHVIALPETAPGRSGTCGDCARSLPYTWLATQLAVLLGSIAMLATWGPGLTLIPFLWLVPVLAVAAVTDLRTMLIPKRVVWVGFGVGVALIAAVAISRGNPGELTTALVGAGAYFGFLFVMHVISPGGMGFGDVRLALVLGLYLGWIDIRLPLFGLLIGNVVYLAYALPQRIRKGRDEGRFSPFGPGLALGTLLAVFFWTSLVPVG